MKFNDEEKFVNEKAIISKASKQLGFIRYETK